MQDRRQIRGYTLQISCRFFVPLLLIPHQQLDPDQPKHVLALAGSQYHRLFAIKPTLFALMLALGAT
jgi:hypothetical protein